MTNKEALDFVGNWMGVDKKNHVTKIAIQLSDRKPHTCADFALSFFNHKN